MKILIIYDSVFGNTRKIAQAIQTALSFLGEVDLVQVGDMTLEQLTGVEFLFVGSPTRQFKATPATTQFLDSIPENVLNHVKMAIFDTRLSPADTKSGMFTLVAKLFGYAAKPMADLLVKKGGTLVVPPEGFIVKDSEGPLKEGEIERAGEWARSAVG